MRSRWNPAAPFWSSSPLPRSPPLCCSASWPAWAPRPSMSHRVCAKAPARARGDCAWGFAEGWWSRRWPCRWCWWWPPGCSFAAWRGSRRWISACATTASSPSRSTLRTLTHRPRSKRSPAACSTASPRCPECFPRAPVFPVRTKWEVPRATSSFPGSRRARSPTSPARTSIRASSKPWAARP